MLFHSFCAFLVFFSPLIPPLDINHHTASCIRIYYRKIKSLFLVLFFYSSSIVTLLRYIDPSCDPDSKSLTDTYLLTLACKVVPALLVDIKGARVLAAFDRVLCGRRVGVRPLATQVCRVSTG